MPETTTAKTQQTPPYPFVSVILSAYNASDHIEESIASVLGQTYSNFEFIIINDGSTDETGSILERYKRADPRIQIITQENAGLTSSLARGVTVAKGDLIARIDADDIWKPEKLACQVAYLVRHIKIGLLGTAYSLIDGAGSELGQQDVPLILGCEAVREAVLSFNPFFHSSVLFRRILITQCGNYDSTFTTAQDYDLWVRMLTISEGDNLGEVLAKRRITDDMISVAKEKQQRVAALRIKLKERWRRKCFSGALLPLCKDLAIILLPRTLISAIRSLGGNCKSAQVRVVRR
jgi:glycosyltransferase involved in cell wall biosynthesis